jgi:hypothetical protein
MTPDDGHLGFHSPGPPPPAAINVPRHRKSVYDTIRVPDEHYPTPMGLGQDIYVVLASAIPDLKILMSGTE